ncbi:bifunctional nuclease family protein [Limibacter armeniacum]|uniref:bifunctional nuclease family protein n=1 Tax=Limibacter armeniacum TaxID=466084 RepID=UPI002FE5DD3B
MDKVRLEILGLSASHSTHGSFALVLGETSGKRRLPIIIGMFEAQAIALEIEKITSNRPMTHDLFKAFANNFQIEIKEVIISDLKEGVFYATMVCVDKDGNVIKMDARPSDAIAIGIRFKAPIFATESILNEAGIKIDDLYEEENEEEDEISLDSDEDEALMELMQEKDESELSTIPVDKLHDMMNAAIEAEDYERAAQIRDEINKRS